MIMILLFSVLNPREETNMFTVEVVHNGFFCGLRDNLQYVSGTYDQFDYLTSNTWSLGWIDEMLSILG